MCIGIPGQVCELLSDNLARVEVCGVWRDVDLTLVGTHDDNGQPRL
ncbi:hydrogenase assembly chaperone, partial [Cronobacter turicensis]